MTTSPDREFERLVDTQADDPTPEEDAWAELYWPGDPDE